MDNGTLFYIFGGALAASAVIVTFLGLKLEKFPGRVAPIVALWFIALIGCATTFAVLHAQDEEHHRAADLQKGNEEVENEEEEGLEAQ
jgi:putative Mn2+ efflux pump MntP